METQWRSVITDYLHERGGGYSRCEARLFKTASGSRVRFKCALLRDKSGTAGEVLSKMLKRAKKKRHTLAFNVEKCLPRVML